MATIRFTHSYVGNLSIDNGIDSAEWAYGLNTATFPTYAGEVVQILSVYIDDLTLRGTITSYQQLGAIYSYFTNYMQAATQGNKTKSATTAASYNLTPMLFFYDERQWMFKIYPKSAPGFAYDRDIAAPVWQLQCHVIDDSPDLSIIKDGIRGAAATSLNSGLANSGASQTILGDQQIKISGEISPAFGDPNTDPFETFDQGAQAAQSAVGKYADYYNSLIPSYMQGDFQSLTGVVGSQPNFGLGSNNPNPTVGKVNIPKTKVKP